MEDYKRILVASLGFGSGHNRAAAAVAEAMSVQFPDAEIKVVDFLTWGKNGWDKFTTFIYFTAIKYIPFVYHLLYQGLSSQRWAHRILLRTYKKKMAIFLKGYPADLIISTHVFCAWASCAIKAEGWGIKAVWGIVTDFIDDAYWNICPLDRFFVATEDLKDKLANKWIERDTIIVAPLPVSGKFHQKGERKELCKKIDTRLKPEMFTVLTLGGGNGLGGIYEVTKEMLHLPVQVLAVAGSNIKLKETLTAMKDNCPNLYVFGYIDNIHELMDMADVCITKPGGITIAECLAKKLPIIIYGRPLPGPEAMNVDYLVNKKMAEHCTELAGLRKAVIKRLEQNSGG
jgi:processive 1,2-diacylglycerol beta-glucosyltransferase